MIVIDCPNCRERMLVHDKKDWPGQEPEAVCGNCGALVLGDADWAGARTGHGLVMQVRLKTEERPG